MSESLHVIPRLPACALGLALAVCCALAAVVYALALPPAALAAACPNEAYRVGPSASLPDCRAYEMVTPAYKEGYPVQVRALAADGTSLVGESFGTFAGVEANSNIDFNGNLSSFGGSYYELARGSSGWTVAPISLPQSQFPVALSADYTADLASSLWLASTPAQARLAVNPYKVLGDFYLREPGGATVDVGPLYPPSAEPELFGQEDFNYDGASSDLSHILFTMYDNHWPGDPTPNGVGQGKEHPSLYEYSGTGNTAPSLVGVSGGQGSTSPISECGTELGAPSSSSERSRNSVSTTAATVFFTALACGSLPAVNELYARVDGGEADAHTVAISEPSPADCAACDTEPAVRAGATFQGASPDGSKVFFTTSQPLLSGDGSNNLYEYDFDDPEGQRLTRVSAGDGTLPVTEAGVQSIPAISNDASHVYFIAAGALTSSPNTLGQTARAGGENLYLFERDTQYPAGRIAFVTDLSGAGLQTDSLSLNGRFLAFVTSAHVTPDDTSAGGQAFEYDAQTGALARVSIGQEGYDSNGNNSAPVLAQRSIASGIDASSPIDAATGLSVTDDGAVFFTSGASLVPQAVSGAANVYEYENGNVYLVSDGHDTSGASLLFVDPSGTDVFFETHDQLVAQDDDTQADVYDARVDGGFPPPAVSPTCEGDACQGQLSTSPVLLSPGSESQAGGGNLPPTASQLAPAAASKGKKAKRKPKVKSKVKRRRGKRVARRVAGVDAKRGGRS